MIKVCLITCYNQPDYIRARTLRAAFGAMNEVELIVVKNTHTNIRRYPEAMWRTIVARFKHHPDVYIQTFRAYESFPFFRLITAGKPFIFDEFINPIEQVAYENGYIKPGSIITKIARLGYKFWLLTVRLIITDTPSHARYSAELMNLPNTDYMPLIVSADEQVFMPKPRTTVKGAPFIVFYYGLFMMPLQGLDTILEAMVRLKNENIELVLIGGKESTKGLVMTAQDKGAKIVYKYRVPFEELADYMNNSDLCLGGPFGGTVQAQYVIGGKTYQYLQTERPVVIGKNEESHIWTDKKDALIVDQKNPKQLAEAIMWAKDHPRELANIAAAGKELYKEELSIKKLTQQLRVLLASEHIL
jgi:glycosyltransferase involved in cell wall biosynthesis